MPIRLVLAVAALLITQLILYFGCEVFQHDMHDVHRPIDDRIPFIEASALVYILWFPQIIVLPLLLHAFDPLTFARYYTAMGLEVLLSVICYLLYPTTFTRPTPSDTWSGKLMKMVYSGSFRGINCAPSLHCSSCYLAIACALVCPGMPLPVRGVLILVAAGIVLSTMTTKQHTLLDALSALPMFLVCWIVGWYLPALPVTVWIAG